MICCSFVPLVIVSTSQPTQLSSSWTANTTDSSCQTIPKSGARQGWFEYYLTCWYGLILFSFRAKESIHVLVHELPSTFELVSSTQICCPRVCLVFFVFHSWIYIIITWKKKKRALLVSWLLLILCCRKFFHSFVWRILWRAREWSWILALNIAKLHCGLWVYLQCFVSDSGFCYKCFLDVFFFPVLRKNSCRIGVSFWVT